MGEKKKAKARGIGRREKRGREKQERGKRKGERGDADVPKLQATKVRLATRLAGRTSRSLYRCCYTRYNPTQ